MKSGPQPVVFPGGVRPPQAAAPAAPPYDAVAMADELNAMVQAQAFASEPDDGSGAELLALIEKARSNPQPGISEDINALIARMTSGGQAVMDALPQAGQGAWGWGKGAPQKSWMGAAREYANSPPATPAGRDARAVVGALTGNEEFQPAEAKPWGPNVYQAVGDYFTGPIKPALPKGFTMGPNGPLPGQQAGAPAPGTGGGPPVRPTGGIPLRQPPGQGGGAPTPPAPNPAAVASIAQAGLPVGHPLNPFPGAPPASAPPAAAVQQPAAAAAPIIDPKVAKLDRFGLDDEKRNTIAMIGAMTAAAAGTPGATLAGALGQGIMGGMQMDQRRKDKAEEKEEKKAAGAMKARELSIQEANYKAQIATRLEEIAARRETAMETAEERERHNREMAELRREATAAAAGNASAQQNFQRLMVQMRVDDAASDYKKNLVDPLGKNMPTDQADDEVAKMFPQSSLGRRIFARDIQEGATAEIAKIKATRISEAEKAQKIKAVQARRNEALRSLNEGGA